MQILHSSDDVVILLFLTNSRIFRITSMYEKESGRLLNRKVQKFPDSYQRHAFHLDFFFNLISNFQ